MAETLAARVSMAEKEAAAPWHNNKHESESS